MSTRISRRECDTFLATLAGFGWGFHRADLEEAFRALVRWPIEASIPGSTGHQRVVLLDGVCRGLISIDDGNLMPRATSDQILDGGQDMDGRTYADGARAVLRNFRHFVNVQKDLRPSNERILTSFNKEYASNDYD